MIYFSATLLNSFFIFAILIMKFISLLSGGKDSLFNTLKCVEAGHELLAVCNLYNNGNW
jgi:hypothetical protein